MFCSNCGVSLHSTNKFCWRCGIRLEKVPTIDQIANAPITTPVRTTSYTDRPIQVNTSTRPVQSNIPTMPVSRPAPVITTSTKELNKELTSMQHKSNVISLIILGVVIWFIAINTPWYREATNQPPPPPATPLPTPSITVPYDKCVTDPKTKLVFCGPGYEAPPDDNPFEDRRLGE